MAKNKRKASGPTIKAPQVSKELKQRLVPYETPKKRGGISGV